MRILIASDASPPQVNGVVTTYARLASELAELGVECQFLTGSQFRTFGLPGYAEIRLAVPDQREANRLIDEAAADYIHVATEGPVGWMARAYCLARGRRFTTSYHTKFPEYAAKYYSLPLGLGYSAARLFHAASSGTMVATPSLRRDLESRGFGNLMSWSRGVDTALYRPRPVRLFGPPPVLLYVGRIAREKNLEAFLDLQLDGRKVVIGDGPYLPHLRSRYADVTFTGMKSGEDLACCYASADAFVFPSRSETFGLVLLEAMASGVPVAAYPVTGPIDVVIDGVNGFVDEDLGRAATRALSVERAGIRASAQRYAWRAVASQFLDNIAAAHRAAPRPERRPPSSAGAADAASVPA